MSYISLENRETAPNLLIVLLPGPGIQKIQEGWGPGNFHIKIKYVLFTQKHMIQ